MTPAHAPRRSLFAFLLIVAGVLLFLDNLGLLPIRDIRAYWPIVVVIYGISILDRRHGQIATVWGLAAIAFGILLILGNLHIIHVSAGVIWPIFLIAFGATMLVRPLRFREWRERSRLKAAEHRNHKFSCSRVETPGEPFSGNRLEESMVFGSLNRRVETQNFEGGKLDAVFGSIELDLALSSISTPDRQAQLEVNAVFGGIEITIPRTWKLVMRNTAVFGGCEDKTVPPRPEPGFEPPTLILTGGAVFGGISIRN